MWQNQCMFQITGADEDKHRSKLLRQDRHDAHGDHAKGSNCNNGVL